MTGRAATGLVVLALTLAAACGNGSVEISAARPVPTQVVVAPTTPAAATTSPRSSTTRTTRTPTAAPATPATPPALDGVSGSQALLVAAPQAGATTASFSAYEKRGGRWRRVFGPWTAFVGRAGVAPPDGKREGDGRTPAGRFGFGFFFGVQPDPGVQGEFRRITGDNIVWDDDPASPRYNTWVDTTKDDAGANPEPMHVSPAYDYGVVIAYNTERTPGLGSAIFLHVSTGRPTAGCVSLARDELLQVLRWLSPSAAPAIVIGSDS